VGRFRQNLLLGHEPKERVKQTRFPME